MSVINQVLNDIEQRKRMESAQNVDNYTALEVNEPRSYALLGFGLFCGLCVLGYVWFTQSQDVVLAEPESLAVTPSPISVVPFAVITAPVMTPQAIEVIKPLAPPSKPKPKLVPVAPQPVVVKHTQPKIVDKPSASIPVKAKLEIKSVQLTAVQLAQLKFNQGLELMAQGLVTQAQSLWQQGLQLQPDNHQARERLALSYFEDNRMKSVFEVLQQGINQYPLAHGLSFLKAKIQLQVNQDKQALATLNRPYRLESASDEMIELAGAIAQQLQVWPQAQLNYSALVKRQPGNHKWLMGLAISLDGQGKSSQAIVRYTQLIGFPGVSQLLSNYAQQRIAILTPSSTNPQSRDNNG